MAESIIAGHTFADTPNGKICHCGMRWDYILSARRENIGETGWAHVGALNDREYDEIEAARDKVWEALTG